MPLGQFVPIGTGRQGKECPNRVAPLGYVFCLESIPRNYSMVLCVLRSFRSVLMNSSQSISGAGASTLTPKLLVYLGTVWLLGTACMVGAAIQWESPDLFKFAGLLVLALLSVGVEVPAPAAGTFPITFLFVLVGTYELTAPETIVLATMATLVQCAWKQRSNLKWAVDQLGFQIAVMAIASTGVTWLSQSQALTALSAHWIADPALRTVFVLLVDTVALFILHTTPLIGAICFSEEVGFFNTWWTVSSWSVPYYFGGGLVALLAALVSRFLGWPALILAGPATYLVFRSYGLYVSRLQNEKKHADEVSVLQLRTIEALASAIEAKDDTTHEHLARVQVYARELGKELGLTELEQEALRAASILHDIGKLAVPEYIISKPGRLTPEEFEKMKIHPVVGAEILEKVEFPYPVAPIVRAHHEKWDGTGYPNGLRGEAIPIGARILAAVDCLDALATDRQYRRALPLDEAMRVIQKDAGTAFDPRVVEVLARRYVELEKLAKQHEPESVKLSKDLKIERGLAPAAGFEAAASNKPPAKDKAPVDFVAQIAAARHEVQTVFELSQDLGGSLSIDEILSLLDAKLRRLIPYDGIVVWIRNKETLEPKYVSGDDHRIFSSLEIPMGQGLSGWVAENRKPILNGNPGVESGYLKNAHSSSLRAAIAVPLEGVDDVVGVLALYHADRDAFTRDHLRILTATSTRIARSIANALSFQRLESNSTVDALTGVMTGRALFSRLDAEISRSRRNNSPTAVLVLDVNNFKSINDNAGQKEGDRMLQAIAHRLRSLCRDYDLIARLGGDEFALVLAGAHPGELGKKIQLMREAVAEASMEIFGGEPYTASIGSAHFPADGANADELLSEAERRMFAEKAVSHTRAAKPVDSAPVPISSLAGLRRETPPVFASTLGARPVSAHIQWMEGRAANQLTTVQ